MPARCLHPHQLNMHSRIQRIRFRQPLRRCMHPPHAACLCLPIAISHSFSTTCHCGLHVLAQKLRTRLHAGNMSPYNGLLNCSDGAELEALPSKRGPRSRSLPWNVRCTELLGAFSPTSSTCTAALNTFNATKRCPACVQHTCMCAYCCAMRTASTPPQLLHGQHH